ncbi:WD40 repeat domain-containing protein [Parapedobacter sp. ISTM3]|uniref:WD40 repeat domain-containing protein n=1 Tax=Parapedobacter sp. ISTM3 TaxID=2800130 RepID=UPI001908B533|nr:WD40 repeat domain-containing protein [Parapedobacter sp. ISTM3]MBK1440897.1 WD40 repeat domain-containing protein [Parapedobacter sp. ISTM3]
MKLEVHKSGILSGHQNPIFAIENGPEPHILFTAGNDKGVVQWDLEKMAFERILYPLQFSVYALHLIAHTPLLAIGMRDGKVAVVDTSVQRLAAKLEHHQRPVFGIKTFSTKPEMVVSSEDGTVSVWNTDTFKLLYHFQVSAQTVRTIAISNDEKWVVFGTKDGKVKLYNALDYSLAMELPGHTMPVTSLCFSPDGRFLLTGGRDAQLNVLDAVEGFSLAKAFTPHLFTVYAIKYHPTLPIFATGSRDKSIKIWAADDFRLLRIINVERGFDSHVLSINDMVWNSYRNQLVSVSDDKQVMVWEIAPQQSDKLR